MKIKAARTDTAGKLGGRAKIPRVVPWSLTIVATVAASVKLHGTSPWHLQESRCCCSRQRETPRRKAVASQVVKVNSQRQSVCRTCLSLPAVTGLKALHTLRAPEYATGNRCKTRSELRELFIIIIDLSNRRKNVRSARRPSSFGFCLATT